MAGTRRIPNPRSQDRSHKRKPCVDCTAEGVTTKRKAPYPGPRCATHHRAKRVQRRTYSHSRHIAETYGITSEEYDRILEYQGGVCYICRRAKGNAKRRLSVDHCHSTGVVRGCLCSPCNKNVLGHLRDDTAALQRAIDYLDEPPAVSAIGKRIVPDME